VYILIYRNAAEVHGQRKVGNPWSNGSPNPAQIPKNLSRNIKAMNLCNQGKFNGVPKMAEIALKL